MKAEVNQRDGLLEITAPTRASADELAARLVRCHCLVVQSGQDEWAVRARPWTQDGRALQAALSTVEAWLLETGARTTQVAVGGRTFTLAAVAAT